MWKCKVLLLVFCLCSKSCAFSIPLCHNVITVTIFHSLITECNHTSIIMYNQIKSTYINGRTLSFFFSFLFYFNVLMQVLCFLIRPLSRISSKLWCLFMAQEQYCIFRHNVELFTAHKR